MTTGTPNPGRHACTFDQCVEFLTYLFHRRIRLHRIRDNATWIHAWDDWYVAIAECGVMCTPPAHLDIGTHPDFCPRCFPSGHANFQADGHSTPDREPSGDDVQPAWPPRSPSDGQEPRAGRHSPHHHDHKGRPMALSATTAFAENLARLPGDVDEPLGRHLFPRGTGNASPARTADSGHDVLDIPSELEKTLRQLENPVQATLPQAVVS